MKDTPHKTGGHDIPDGTDKASDNEGPLCKRCRHHHKSGYSCDAFEIIPAEIRLGQVRHTKPMFGQRNQIVFELKK